MHQIALFVGGLLLGVLISVSLLQSDFISLLFGKSAPNVAILSQLTTPISQPTLSSQLEKSYSASVSTARSNDVSLSTKALLIPAVESNKVNSSPLQNQEIPKWTPGRGSELDKYRKEAQIAQEIMSAVGTNNPPFSLPTKPSPAAAENDIQAIKEDFKAIGRQIKKLRRRQIDLEQNGRDSSEVKAKINELQNKRTSTVLNPTTPAASTDNSKSAEEELARAFDVAAGRSSSPRRPKSQPKQRPTHHLNDITTTTKSSTGVASIVTPLPAFQSPSKSIGAWPDVTDSSLYRTRSIIPGVPAVPYHHQALRDWNKYNPYTPTLEEVTKEASTNKNVVVPNMSKQRGIIEPSNLKLHMCNAVFEAYSASYLTTREHVLAVGSEGYNLTWVNCEMASFIHMKESNRFYQNPHAPTSHGIIIQTLDVLDYSAIHLSAFERSQKKHKDAIWNNESDRRKKWKEIKEVEIARDYLRRLNDPAMRDKNRNIRYSEEAQRTVVVMPFLGGAMGAGHSELGNRFVYLQTCFWSLYEFFPHIVAGVARQEDVAWAFNESGLPFFDIILLPNLPKSAGLPVGTMQAVKQRFLRTTEQTQQLRRMPTIVTQGHPEGTNPISQNFRNPANSQNWAERFDYVFFTESDQIVIIRELALLYRHLKQFPRHMLLPHRLMPYSVQALQKGHTRKDAISIKPNAWMNQSCCMPRQNCVERKTWKPLSDISVPVVSYYGLLVPLGNVNFLTESYRYCKLGGYLDYCP